jgi:hypothetical protein
MCNQAKISIVRAFLLLLLRAIFVVDPNIEIEASVNILGILELNLESSMSKPLAVNLTLESLMNERTGINLSLSSLSLLESLSLLRSHFSHHLG